MDTSTKVSYDGHNVGLFYISEEDGKKYFHKSFIDVDSLEHFVKNDKEFEAIKKKQVIVIQLQRSSYGEKED